MTVTASDLIRLPYDDTLTLAGIDYARKSLHYTYNRMGLGLAARLRKIVAGIAVEFAFVRWLEKEGAQFNRLGSTHFTRRDLFDIGLAGRRVDLKSYLISDKAKIRALRRDPAWVLDASALVPVDQLASESLEEHDLYVFGFLAGLETRTAHDLRAAIDKRQPAYLLHTLNSQAWTGQGKWKSLGRLALKSNARRPVEIMLGGQDAGREAHIETLSLPPKVRGQTESEFYSVLYLHMPTLPDGAIGVYSPVLKETRLVAPDQWSNIWVYGLEVFLAGYLTKRDFRRWGKRLLADSPVKQYTHTSTDNYAVPVARLRPMADLLRAARSSD